MCGILGIFDVAPGTTQSTLRAKLIECARRMRHRGPDWSGYQLISQGKDDKQELGAGQHASSESLQRLCIAEHGVRGAAKHAIAHERLAIIDPESGAQPLFAAECKQAGIEEGSIIVAANGEIYNYKELYELLKREGVPYEPNTGSDCEVLIPLYVKFGLEKACSLLRGVDPRGNQIHGVCSMEWRLTNPPGASRSLDSTSSDGHELSTQVCSRSSSTTNGRVSTAPRATTLVSHHYTWEGVRTGRSGSRPR